MFQKKSFNKQGRSPAHGIPKNTKKEMKMNFYRTKIALWYRFKVSFSASFFFLMKIQNGIERSSGEGENEGIERSAGKGENEGIEWSDGEGENEGKRKETDK